MSEEKKKSWFRRHPVLTGIIGFFLFLIILWAFGSNPQGNITGNVIKEETQETISILETQEFNKMNLKEDIEEISFTTHYIPKVSVLTFQDNNLFIEYSSFETENTGIFNEQQKVSEKIILYFETNKIQKPNEVAFRVNGITNEHTVYYPVFEIKLSWEDAVKMANLELSYSSWLNNVENTKKIK